MGNLNSIVAYQNQKYLKYCINIIYIRLILFKKIVSQEVVENGDKSLKKKEKDYEQDVMETNSDQSNGLENIIIPTKPTEIEEVSPKDIQMEMEGAIDDESHGAETQFVSFYLYY